MDKTSVDFFANVILPVPLRQVFSYRIPPGLLPEVSPGKRVIVQFGPKKFYSAVVLEIHSNPSEGYVIKDIVSVIDDLPVVNALQLEFWKWIAGYYMCSTGEVMKAALPSGLKLESETRLCFVRDFETSVRLSDVEMLVLDLLEKNPGITLSDLSKSLHRNDLLKVIKKLVDAGAVSIEETIRESFRPKTETFVSIPGHLANDEELHRIFDDLHRAPKQLQLFMKFIQLSDLLNSGNHEIKKNTLLMESGTTPEVLNALKKKGYLQIYEKELIPGDAFPEESNLKMLSDLQMRILDQIKQVFAEKQVILLHGYTASGKTELYIRLIDEQLKLGKQVLYLLPEIALTAQIINRLKNAFGKRVGVYHSKFSDSDRVGVWKALLDEQSSNSYQLILGVRSSVFLPFSKLGLVIVDEEHENSYKQFDPAPRYHARDAAIVLAGMHQAKVLLGTATPSVESYFNAENGKYGLVKLFQRFSNVPLPEIKIANTADARERKQMKSHFHPMLLESMKNVLDQGEQVILFKTGEVTLLIFSVPSVTPSQNASIAMLVLPIIKTLIFWFAITAGTAQPKLINASPAAPIRW